MYKREIGAELVTNFTQKANHTLLIGGIVEKTLAIYLKFLFDQQYAKSHLYKYFRLWDFFCHRLTRRALRASKIYFGNETRSITMERLHNTIFNFSIYFYWPSFNRLDDLFGSTVGFVSL